MVSLSKKRFIAELWLISTITSTSSVTIATTVTTSTTQGPLHLSTQTPYRHPIHTRLRYKVKGSDYEEGEKYSIQDPVKYPPDSPFNHLPEYPVEYQPDEEYKLGDHEYLTNEDHEYFTNEANDYLTNEHHEYLTNEDNEYINNENDEYINNEENEYQPNDPEKSVDTNTEYKPYQPSGVPLEYPDFDEAPHCEPLKSEECQGLGYDSTFFPNLLNHRTQEVAQKELEKHKELLTVSCSDVVRELVCSLYMPVCTDYGFHLPPCRQLCRQAQVECEGAVVEAGLSWPDKLDCTRFPEHHELMCVQSLSDHAFFGSHTSSSTSIPPTWTPFPPTHGPDHAQALNHAPNYAQNPNHAPTLTQCVSNADCIFERSVCRAGECVCEYPRTWGPYGCEDTQILGGQCSSDNQCSSVTPNAVCRHQRCVCAAPLTNYKNLACIHGSSIGSLCYNDAQCRALNAHSFCRLLVAQVVGTCACDPDQFIDAHGRCAPRLGGRCRRGTCPRQLGVASCQKGREHVLKCFCRKKAVQRRGVCVLR